MSKRLDWTEIVQRLFALYGVATQEELGAKLGVSQDLVSKWVRKKARPTFDKLEKVVDELGVGWDLLLTGEHTMDRYNTTNIPKAARRTRDVQIVGLAACNIEGWFSPGWVAASVPLPIEYKNAEIVFAVIAVGKSMEPEGIREGNLVFCDPGTAPVPGDPVYVKTKDGKAALKKFLRRDEAWLYLRGWSDPDDQGVQKPYTDQRAIDTVDMVACVVMVKIKP